MGKILFAWELGSGMGHLTRMLPVARQLHDFGYDIILAVPRIEAARSVVNQFFPAKLGVWRLNFVEVVGRKAPTIRAPADFPVCTLADVLSRFLNDDQAMLVKNADRWRELLDKFRPELIVADFAPTLRLAHAGAQPFVMLGNGYTIPPPDRSLPPIRPWQTDPPSTSKRHEVIIRDRLNEFRRRWDEPSIRHLSDMFNGDVSHICTIPEFDPYRQYRDAPTLEPFNVPVVQRRPHLSKRQGNTIVIYLPCSHPHLRIVLRAVTRMRLPCQAYIPGAPAEAIAKLAGRNVVIHRNPIDFGRLLHRFKAVIHHAGLATAYAALRAGTPQLVMPIRLEHVVTGRGLEQFGATVVNPANKPIGEDQIIEKIKYLMHDNDVADAAYDVAQMLRKKSGTSSLKRIVDSCIELLDKTDYRSATQGVSTMTN